MVEDEPIPIRGSYRARSHLPIWQLMLACDIWQQVGLEMVAFDFIASARQAEGLLLEGIANAYELACIQTPSTRGQASPLALWDLHYLRELDASGFIDALYADRPLAVGTGSA